MKGYGLWFSLLHCTRPGLAVGVRPRWSLWCGLVRPGLETYGYAGYSSARANQYTKGDFLSHVR